MTWRINVDNGGMTTGFCLADGGEVRHTKTLVIAVSGPIQGATGPGLAIQNSS
jgi:hypothetical protein